MFRKKKIYLKPKRPFDKARIEEEVKIKKDYGLKNKTEIWKAEAKIKSMREKAKKLISANQEEQQALFNRLKKIGIKVNSIGDVLALDKKDYLEQRLQTILVKKMMARTMKSARQLITHKKVLVNGKVVSAPSYIVPLDSRDKISLKVSKKKPVKESKQEVIGEKSKTTSKPKPSIKEDKELTKNKISSPTGEAIVSEAKPSDEIKPETAPAEEQVEKKEENKKVQKEVIEDAKENA